MVGDEDVLFLALSSHGERDAALKVTKSPLLAASAANLPDLDQAADRRPH